MKIEKNNTNKNKKKIVGALAIGGLVLSAPFSAFAFNDNNMNPSSFDKKDLRQDNLNSLLIEPNYEKQVEKLELAIEKKIEQANLLLENVELSDSIEDDLYEIIGEFAELESYLEDLNLSGEEAEMLKEIFLEDKEEATGLVSEFRDIITANLTSDEIEVLKEVIKPEVETKIREADMRVMAPKFTAESLEIIDSDLAEEYKNGVLSEEEVALSVKVIMDELSDDERHDLMEEIRTNMEENGIQMPNKEDRGVMAPKFTVESLEIIDSDLAEEYKNGVLSEEEVALSVKAIMDELSDDERHDLMEKIRINMEENGIEMLNKEDKGVIGMEGKMGGMRR